MIENTLKVGSKIRLGWNGAKLLGDATMSSSYVTIVAFGSDWVIVRSKCGYGLRCATFPTARPLVDMVKELSE